MGNIFQPRVFISYSWSSPEHKQWVLDLAISLRRDGIKVDLDRWDLKPGHDTNKFMEKKLHDPDIKKVLVICDRDYQAKANDRSGGVGTEAELISRQIYDNSEQEKFIPIIKEYDDEGRPCIPNFMSSRFFFDLSKMEDFLDNYKNLILNLYGQSPLQKPPLGKPPNYVIIDGQISSERASAENKIEGVQTFHDVPTSHWAFDYIEQLVDDGVLDYIDNFCPGDTINRAEFVKIVITAIDGLAGYEPPKFPTFDDVQTSSKFYDYVESALQLGIISGYTDGDGNLTGLFGPNDLTSREWAVKVLVNTFAIPITLMPPSIFADVPTSHPYHNYILAAYNQSVFDISSGNLFHPKAPLTRDLMAKWVINAQDPIVRSK